MSRHPSVIIVNFVVCSDVGRCEVRSTHVRMHAHVCACVYVRVCGRQCDRQFTYFDQVYR